MYVYFIRAGDKGAIKIGVASDIDRRISELQVGNAFKLNLICKIPCTSRAEAASLELRLHSMFAAKRIRGEWFQPTISFKSVDKVLIDCSKTETSIGDETPTYIVPKPKRPKKKKP